LAAPGATAVPETAPALIRPDPAAPPAAPGAPAPDGLPPAPGAAPATRPVEPSDIERSRPKRWLLSIGIGEYRDPLMHGVGANAGKRQRIFSSKRDADLMSTELKQSLGFESVAVGTASKAEIVGAFNVLKAFAQPQDSVVVYYAGYGQSDPSRKHCYWSTSTSRHDDPQQWISNRNTGDMLGAIRANQVILLVDSCFADAVREDDRVDIEAVAARGAGRTGQRAATVMVSGTNAPLADKNQGDNSAFANSIVTRTHDLKAPLRGVQVFVDVRSKIAELLSRITEDAYIVGYRGSARAGHRPGGDFVFRPKAQSPEDP
jgi:hypothetical protein